MKGRNRGNLLLTELVIVILFFALSATVIIRLFMSSYAVSVKSEYTSAAVMETGNLAERLYAASDMEQLLLSEGYVFSEGDYALETEHGLFYRVTLSGSDFIGGKMLSAAICVTYNDEEITRLECKRYFPEVIE